MTPKQLESLYKLVCDGKGFAPNDGQFKIWKQTLGFYEEKDVSQAITSFFQRNSTFPMPAELRPLIESARRQRIAKAGQPSVYTLWRCMECGYRFGTWNIDLVPRRCHGTLPVHMKHADFGKACLSTSFAIIGRDTHAAGAGR